MEAPSSGSVMMQGNQGQTVGSNSLHPAGPHGTPQTMGPDRLDPARPEMMQGSQPQTMGSNSLEPPGPHGADGTAGTDTDKPTRSAASRCHVLKLDKYNDQGANNEVGINQNFVILLIR